VLLSYRDILTSGSLFQAFSFGAPVIAPSLGSIPAYVVDGWNGFLYESPEELGKILNDFKKLSKLKVSTMGENGLTSIKSISWP
jgi:glycosyltransferase involved in cell wall biosynthesis